MKILVLNGEKKSDGALKIVYEIIKNEFEIIGWEVHSFLLRDIEITGCVGCFYCWTKTPGKCVINDAGSDIASMAFKSDLLVFLTPVTFGGYSFELKKVVDRLVTAILPSCMKINNEFHHKLRSKRSPRFIALGMLMYPDDVSKTIFETLTHRNAINLQSPAYASKVLLSTQTKESIIEEIKTTLVKVGVIK